MKMAGKESGLMSEDSDSDSGSSTDEEAQRMEDGGVFTYARRREEASGSGHRRGKYKVDVRKVLKALSMVTEDEEAQKRRKEACKGRDGSRGKAEKEVGPSTQEDSPVPKY